jgi:proline dehydrogenase
MTATDDLRHLHDRLRTGVGLVSQLEALLLEGGEPDAKLEAFDRVSVYLQDVVAPHLRAELVTLYPEAERVGAIDGDLGRRLIDSCDRLEGAASRVLQDHARLRGGAADNLGYRQRITALVRLLRRHLQTVEDELLPQLGRELTDSEVRHIYERMVEAASDEEIAARVPAGAEAAVAAARRLRDQGIEAELSCLSQPGSDAEVIERTVAGTIEAGRLLAASGLGVRLSVDPAAIGLLGDAAAGHRNAERIARFVAQQPAERLNLATLDMEDLASVEPTLELHRGLLGLGLTAGITLQARLRRTAEDLEPLLRRPTAVRLVKGAFPLGPEHDHQGGRAISAAYLALATRMLGPEARKAGLRPVFATHDEALVRRIATTARRAGWMPDGYEFEMVVGVRLDVQRWLRGEGLSVRAYLPFGTVPWPLAVRRPGEHPAEAMHLGEARAAANPRWAAEAASAYTDQR